MAGSKGILATKGRITSAPTLLGKWKATCGFIVMVRFHTALRGLKSAMPHNDITSTGESLHMSVQGVTVRYVRQLTEEDKWNAGSRMDG